MDAFANRLMIPAKDCDYTDVTNIFTLENLAWSYGPLTVVQTAENGQKRRNSQSKMAISRERVDRKKICWWCFIANR